MATTMQLKFQIMAETAQLEAGMAKAGAAVNKLDASKMKMMKTAGTLSKNVGSLGHSISGMDSIGGKAIGSIIGMSSAFMALQVSAGAAGLAIGAAFIALPLILGQIASLFEEAKKKAAALKELRMAEKELTAPELRERERLESTVGKDYRALLEDIRSLEKEYDRVAAKAAAAGVTATMKQSTEWMREPPGGVRRSGPAETRRMKEIRQDIERRLEEAAALAAGGGRQAPLEIPNWWAQPGNLADMQRMADEWERNKNAIDENTKAVKEYIAKQDEAVLRRYAAANAAETQLLQRKLDAMEKADAKEEETVLRRYNAANAAEAQLAKMKLDAMEKEAAKEEEMVLRWYNAENAAEAQLLQMKLDNQQRLDDEAAALRQELHPELALEEYAKRLGDLVTAGSLSASDAALAIARQRGARPEGSAFVSGTAFYSPPTGGADPVAVRLDKQIEALAQSNNWLMRILAKLGLAS